MEPIKMLSTVGATSPIGRPQATDTAPAGAPSFGDLLTQALDNVNRAGAESKELSRRFTVGDPSVSLEETMITMAKSGVQFQAAVQVRNRLVQAYSAIMNMQI